jgi:hypothetical protein
VGEVVQPLLQKRGQFGAERGQLVELRTALEQSAPLPRHTALIICIVAHCGRRRSDDRIDGVEAGRDARGRLPLAAPIAEGERHVVQIALGELLTIAVERPAGAGDLSGEGIGEQRLLVVVLGRNGSRHVNHVDHAELSLPRKRPGVSQPQTADAGVEVTGTRQLGGATAQRPHQPPVGIDTEKAAGPTARPP